MLKKIGVEYIHKNNQSRNKYRKNTNNTMTGIPDLIIFFPFGECVFVELKTETGIISENQENKIKKLEKYGYKCYICRTVQQFRDIIEIYLKR